MFEGLGNATVYFKTADEAVRDKAKLGSHRFRIEGTVLQGTERNMGDDGLAFTITANGVEVPVVHRGSEPPLFEFWWAPLPHAVPELIAGHGEMLPALTDAMTDRGDEERMLRSER